MRVAGFGRPRTVYHSENKDRARREKWRGNRRLPSPSPSTTNRAPFWANFRDPVESFRRSKTLRCAMPLQTKMVSWRYFLGQLSRSWGKFPLQPNIAFPATVTVDCKTGYILGQLSRPRGKFPAQQNVTARNASSPKDGIPALLFGPTFAIAKKVPAPAKHNVAGRFVHLIILRKKGGHSGESAKKKGLRFRELP